MPVDQKKRRRKKKKVKKKPPQVVAAEELAQQEAAAAAVAVASPTASQKEQALKFKSDGNAALQNGRFADAIAKYTAAIELDPAEHVFYSNRSAAHLKNGDANAATADAERCIEIKPDWIKGYSRLGAALFAGNDIEGAMRAYLRGLVVDPTNDGLQESLAQVRNLSKKPADSQATSAPILQIVKGLEPDDASPAPPPAHEEVEPVIGIDLGTTYSCVAVWGEDGVEIIADAEGNRTTPSVVGFTEDGARLVGHAAKAQAASNARHTVFDVKRILGLRMDDPQVRSEIKRFPFAVLPSRADIEKPSVEVRVSADGTVRRFLPEEISAIVLGHMKRIAENRLGRRVHKAVVTVPAYFNDAQRQATKAAGTIAGLEVLRIINEPTAAALAYGLDVKEGSGAFAADEARRILVFDLGGGTFDVSLLSIEGGIFEVKATGGDTHLGGEDFDNALIDVMVAEFMKIHGKANDPSGNARGMKRLRVACEKAKRLLSSSESTTIRVEAMHCGLDFSCTMTRSRFDKLNEKLFGRCLDTVKRVLRDAKMTPADVDEIVLVGGSTRVPRIQELLLKFFKQQSGLCKSINPDEAVAFGAAVQGAILSGARNDTTNALLLVDVTPLSLGIECTGKVFSTIIPRNTAVPVTKSKTYTTEEDYQESIDVPIYEGERQCTDGNNLLGEFRISGIERAKRGIPQVEVSFSLDANGILSVSARDTVTGASAKTTVAKNRSLSEAQIHAALAEAERYKEEDARRIERIELLHEIEAQVYSGLDRARASKNDSVLNKLEVVRDWVDAHHGASKEELDAQRSSVERLLAELRV